MPFALFGALLAVLIRGLSNDVYFQIGLTMLVALAAKNAILIFEFAVLNRESGMSAYDAAMTAARERLRPIVMTSLEFILGVSHWPLPSAHRKTADTRSAQVSSAGCWRQQSSPFSSSRCSTTWLNA